MTVYHVKPGATGGNGTVASPWAPDDAGFRAAILADGADTFYWRGSGVRAWAGHTTANIIPIGSGVSRAKPKVIRFDWPDDPGVLWGGALVPTGDAGNWTDLGGGVWQRSLGHSLSAANSVLSLRYKPATERRRIVRTLADPPTVADTFHFNDSGNVLKVKLAEGTNPAGELVIPTYGWHLEFDPVGTRRPRFITIANGRWYIMRRWMTGPASGTSRRYVQDLTLSNMFLADGDANMTLFWNNHSANLTVAGCDVEANTDRGAFSFYYTTGSPAYLEDGTSTRADTGPTYNMTGLRISNTKIKNIGVGIAASTSDTAGILTQTVAEATFAGIGFENCSQAIHIWTDNASVVNQPNNRIRCCHAWETRDVVGISTAEAYGFVFGRAGGTELGNTSGTIWEYLVSSENLKVGPYTSYLSQDFRVGRNLSTNRDTLRWSLSTGALDVGYTASSGFTYLTVENTTIREPRGRVGLAYTPANLIDSHNTYIRTAGEADSFVTGENTLRSWTEWKSLTDSDASSIFVTSGGGGGGEELPDGEYLVVGIDEYLVRSTDGEYLVVGTDEYTAPATDGEYLVVGIDEYLVVGIDEYLVRSTDGEYLVVGTDEYLVRATDEFLVRA